MEPENVAGATHPAKDASTRINSRAGRDDPAEDEIDLEFIETGVISFEPKPEPRPVDERLGMAILRLRLYRGWSQRQLGRVSKVDQSIISRLERGKAPGLAVRRVYALLRALRAEEITFGPGLGRVPQSSWEDAMYGDMWERAGRLAEARLNRRRSA